MAITHFPRCRVTKYDNRVGETKTMRCGLTATITEYHNRHDITVVMSDGVTLYKRTYTAFTQGAIDPARVRADYRKLPTV